MSTITKLDIKAMKLANSVVFRSTPEGHTIECVKHADDNNPFETRHHIEVYGNKKDAVTVILCSNLHEELQTVANILKPGDIVYLYWYKGAMNSQLLTDANLVGDCLFLQWQRGKKKFSFKVRCEINHPNYRMIKD